MNILLIHQYFLEKNDGGGSRFNEMTKSWAQEGHDVTVLAGMFIGVSEKKDERYNGKYTYVDKEFYSGVQVIRTHVSASYNVNFAGRLWAYFSFVFSSIYAGLFKAKGKYDVIVVTSPPLFVGITAFVLSRWKRVPFVFEVRDLWPESAIDTGVLQNGMIIKFAYWFENFIYKKAKLVNVLTPAFRTKLIDKGVPKDKIIFIPNAADFSLAEAVQKEINVQEFKESIGLKDKFIITYVGAHGVANHLIQLLDAAILLKNTNVVFQLIGFGMQKQELIDDKNKRHINNVVFRDAVPKAEVFKYILASDMGVSVLKKVDTFKTIYSNKTFDYMSCKKPTLLAIDGVSRELIEIADCGIYVEPENPEAIVAGILSVKDKPNRLIEMGENGYNYAIKNFDRTVLSKKYIDYMKNVIV